MREWGRFNMSARDCRAAHFGASGVAVRVITLLEFREIGLEKQISSLSLRNDKQESSSGFARIPMFQNRDIGSPASEAGLSSFELVEIGVGCRIAQSTAHGDDLTFVMEGVG